VDKGTLKPLTTCVYCVTAALSWNRLHGTGLTDIQITKHGVQHPEPWLTIKWLW